MSRSEVQGPRLFTLEEAQALIPFVRDRLARGRSLLERFEAVRKDLSVLRLVASSGGTESNPDRDALVRKQQEEAALVREIRKVEAELVNSGCVPKSLSEGLIDFFAIKDGRLVFLCWRQGEERIEAWHTLDGGFSGRMPISTFLGESTPDASA